MDVLSDGSGGGWTRRYGSSGPIGCWRAKRGGEAGEAGEDEDEDEDEDADGGRRVDSMIDVERCM